LALYNNQTEPFAIHDSSYLHDMIQSQTLRCDSPTSAKGNDILG